MKKPEELRSHRWFGREGMRTFNHRSRMAQIGWNEAEYRGKPVIAILNTWSEINPCHTHFRQRAVLMGGCDKTTPGLIMGATSMDLPFVYMPAGPMLNGNASGKTLGSGTDMFKGWQSLRAGDIDQSEWEDLLSGIARSPGHCATTRGWRRR